MNYGRGTVRKANGRHGGGLGDGSRFDTSKFDDRVEKQHSVHVRKHKNPHQLPTIGRGSPIDVATPLDKPTVMVLAAVIAVSVVLMHLIASGNAENRQRHQRQPVNVVSHHQKKKTDESESDDDDEDLSSNRRRKEDDDTSVYRRKPIPPKQRSTGISYKYYINESGTAVIPHHPRYNPPSPRNSHSQQHSPVQDRTTVRHLPTTQNSFDSLTDPQRPLLLDDAGRARHSPDPQRVEATPRPRRTSSMDDKTPIAGNTRFVMRSIRPPPAPPVIENPFSHQNTDSYPSFASPPRRQSIARNDQTIPFVPSLGDTHREASNDILDSLESGNVPLLEFNRPVDATPPLAPRPAPQPPQLPNLREQIMATMDSASSATRSIPSGDPRKSIVHKRDDLTLGTDSEMSLQGTIDFAELQKVEIIGGGGFGQVWKAIWNGTPVAVKVLTGSAQSKNVSKAVLQEFAAEINLLKGMRHPNICLYMGACLVPPNRAIITELAENGSLWDALRLPLSPPFSPCDGTSRSGWPDSLYRPDSRHGVPPARSLSSSRLLAVPPKGTWMWALVKRVACGAARGMAYLHNGKPPILHRDLKSANILLDESYRAKVCDFGLSRLKAKEQSMTGNCGTVQWMAPEVLANQEYNEKADVFSYGIICWEMLTRQCPYDPMTPIQCALAVLQRDHRPEIPKWCPPPLHALIRSCLKKNPDERPTFAQIIVVLDGMP